jgi:hypothetical protein
VPIQASVKIGLVLALVMKSPKISVAEIAKHFPFISFTHIQQGAEGKESL